MTKHSNRDFSKHNLIISETDDARIYSLKLGDSKAYSVTFINSNGILAVTGDYYNWIFCREFDPRKESNVDSYYWNQKLKISSRQDPNVFNPDSTKKEIEDKIQELVLDGDNEGVEFYKKCLEFCSTHDLNEYMINCVRIKEVYNCHNDYDIIYHTTTDHSLLIIYDAFQEIITRLKKLN